MPVSLDIVTIIIIIHCHSIFLLVHPSLTFHCLHSVVSSGLRFISLPASDFCSYFIDDGCCIASEMFDSVVNFCFLASVIVIVSLCVLLATQAFLQLVCINCCTSKQNIISCLCILCLVCFTHNNVYELMYSGTTLIGTTEWR